MFWGSNFVCEDRMQFVWVYLTDCLFRKWHGCKLKPPPPTHLTIQVLLAKI